MLNTLCSFFFLVHHSMLPNTNSCLTCLHLWPFCTWTLTWGSGLSVSRDVLSGSHCYQSQVFVLVPLEKRGGGVSQLTQQPKPNDLRWSQWLLLRFLIVVTFPCEGDMRVCIFLHILMTLHAVSWISWCDVCQQATKGNCFSFSQRL